MVFLLVRHLGRPSAGSQLVVFFICCYRSGLSHAVRCLCASFSPAVFCCFQAAFRDILGQRAAARGCLLKKGETICEIPTKFGYVSAKFAMKLAQI